MEDLQRITLKHPRYTNTGVITDRSTLFIEDSQRSSTIYSSTDNGEGKDYIVIDGPNALSLKYNPISKNHFVFGYGDVPTVAAPLMAVHLVYSKALKFVCAVMPRCKSSSIYKTALIADGHGEKVKEIYDWKIWATDEAKNGNCHIWSGLNILASIDKVFKGYKMFYVDFSDFYKWNSAKLFLYQNRGKYPSYLNPELSRDDFFKELEYIRPFMANHPIYHDPMFMTNEQIITVIESLIPDFKEKFERVDHSSLNGWFKRTFDTKLVFCNEVGAQATVTTKKEEGNDQ